MYYLIIFNYNSFIGTYACLKSFVYKHCKRLIILKIRGQIFHPGWCQPSVDSYIIEDFYIAGNALCPTTFAFLLNAVSRTFIGEIFLSVV